jgi:hypothetical protein
MRDIRRLFGSKYDAGLRQLLLYYKLRFPSLVEKRK